MGWWLEPTTNPTTQATTFPGAVVAQIATGRVAFLGDSITAQAGSAGDYAASLLGWQAVNTRFAVGGSYILDQLTKIQAIVDSGAQKVMLQIGTNNVIRGDSVASEYADYCTLFKAIIGRGLSLYAAFIPPLSGAYTDKVYHCNLAMFMAAQKFGVPTYDIWGQFASVAGGWSVATCSSDSTHPILSSRVTAGTTWANLIKTGAISLPQPRTTSDSLISNPCFTGAGPIATSWNAYSSPASMTRSVEADGTGGQQKQVVSFLNPTTGQYGGVQIPVSSSNWAVGDSMVIHGTVEFTANVDESVYDQHPRAEIQVEFTRSSGGNLTVGSGARIASGTRNFWFPYTIPALATGSFVELLMGGLAANVTGTVTMKWKNVACSNLTALGIA